MGKFFIQCPVFVHMALCIIQGRPKFCLFYGQYALYLYCFCLKAYIKRKSGFQALVWHDLHNNRHNLSKSRRDVKALVEAINPLFFSN